MKKKATQNTKQKTGRVNKSTEAPVKGGLEALSEYFGSYLSALELVNSRS